MKKIFLLIALLFSVVTSFAQAAADTIEMADALRSSGKIYVVVAVLLIIFTGIILYLIRLDRKITNLEKEQQKTNK